MKSIAMLTVWAMMDALIVAFVALPIILAILGTAPAARADPFVSEKQARAAIARYVKEGREIVYFETTRKNSMYMSLIQSLGDAYEGMQLAALNAKEADFMGNHPIIIGNHSTRKSSSGSSILFVRDEVTLPVWSKKNGASVLRSVVIDYTTGLLPNDQYQAIDGRTHYLKVK